MIKTLNYNFHNILKSQINGINKKKVKLIDLNLPFSYFETQEEISEPDIILNIGKFTPHNKDCYVVDHRYFVKNNYLYCKDVGSTAKWEFEIFGFENGKTIINYYGKIRGPEGILFPYLLPQDILLRQLIEYKLNKKGYFLAHAAAVSKDGKAVLLIGRGSSFKTSITMDFVRKAGFSFLGDERVIINKERKVLSFPLHLKTFEYKAENLSTENFKGPFKKLRYLKFLRYLYKNSDYKSSTIPIIDSSTINAVFFINRMMSTKGVQINEIDTKMMMQKLLINNKIEAIKSHNFMIFDYGHHFYKYLLAYEFVFPISKITAFWNNAEKKLRGFLEKIPIYEVEIPEKYNLSIYNRILEMLGNH